MAELHRKTEGGCDIYTFANGLRLVFRSRDGALLSVENGRMRLTCAGLYADAGVDGTYAGGGFKFQSFLDFNTWTLPKIEPNDVIESQMFRLQADGEGIVAKASIGPLGVLLKFDADGEDVRIGGVFTNRSDKALWINGVALSLFLPVDEQASFDFPGNVPCGSRKAGDMKLGETVQTGLVGTVAHLEMAGMHVNCLFVNPEEKWATGVHRPSEDMLQVVFLSATELDLVPGESFKVGDMAIQLVGAGDRYATLRAFYERHGWRPPADGVKDAVIYSCHPSGTMDANFPLKLTLSEYADYLDTLAEMGIDTVWLLPVFDHYEEGDPKRNVYTPTDQMPVDPRYGGDTAMKAFAAKAREKGIRVIFDYVPHGPRPHDPEGRKHLHDWASVKRDGTPQLEWTCLSFDMANPTYLDYLRTIVASHIDRFGIGGTRIDCAMGGLSNWKPYPGNRPSSSNMKGGVGMSRALRETFVQKGVKPFVTPENFHPVPLYYSCTDAYYDFALYRVLYDLNRGGLPRAAYVRALAEWLQGQQLSTPEGFRKMRFLGNHDTVSWVWDCRRATAVYGVERAKAMWALISFIDGMPMIYQGDEDPAWYMNEITKEKYPEGQPVLKDFFTALFTTRKKYLSHEHKTNYIFTDTPVFAFTREKGEDRKLVLINLGDETERYELTEKPGKTLYGSCRFEGNAAILRANECVMLSLNPNPSPNLREGKA